MITLFEGLIYLNATIGLSYVTGLFCAVNGISFSQLFRKRQICNICHHDTEHMNHTGFNGYYMSNDIICPGNDTRILN